MRNSISPQVCLPGNVYRVGCLNQIVIVLSYVFVQSVQMRGRDEVENVGLVINIPCPPPTSVIKVRIKVVQRHARAVRFLHRRGTNQAAFAKPFERFRRLTGAEGLEPVAKRRR